MTFRQSWLFGVTLSLGALVLLHVPAMATDQNSALAREPAKEGVFGKVRLKSIMPFPEAVKSVLVSKDFGNPRVALALTVSNRLLAVPGPGKFKAVFQPAKPSNKVDPMPDPFGRSIGITEAGPGGAFYLFDASGKQLAKVSKLSDYRHVFSEPMGPLLVSRPTGGWAGWPSLWKATGSRSEIMSKGWPEGHAVAMVHFSPDGKAIAVLSKLDPTNHDFTISVYSPTGSLLWRTQTPTEAEWTAASLVYSKSGRHLAAASRTRLRVYDRKGQVVFDEPIATTSDRYIRFSSDEKKIAVSLGDSAQMFDIASGASIWSWGAKTLQDSGMLPAGRLHLSRLDSSQDSKTVVLSGKVADWEPGVTEHGEPTRMMVTRAEFFAVLREGTLFDLVKLPPNTLLGDFSESLGTAKAIAVSGSGSNILVPSHTKTFQYETLQR